MSIEGALKLAKKEGLEVSSIPSFYRSTPYEYINELSIERDKELHEQFTENTRYLVNEFENYLGRKDYLICEASEIEEEDFSPSDFMNSECYPIDFSYINDLEEWIFRVNYETSKLIVLIDFKEAFSYDISKWSEIGLKAMLVRCLWFRMMNYKNRGNE